MPDRISYNRTQLNAMTDREVRQAYSRVRAIARKRVLRLEAAGFGEFDLLKSGRAPGARGFSTEMLREMLLDLSVFTRDQRSSVKGMRAYVDKMTESLSESGYNIKRLDRFGNFMEDMRERFRSRTMPHSDIIAAIYEESERLGMSPKWLERQYSKYLQSAESAEKLLQIFERSEKRISHRKLVDAFGDNGDLDS